MIEVKAVLLEEEDIKTKGILNNNEACVGAGIVVFRGKIVKNRYGAIDTADAELRQQLTGMQ